MKKQRWFLIKTPFEPDIVKVIVASLNPAKLRAVKQGFSHHFSESITEFIPVEVDSGVSEQPRSDEETRQGAGNRARNAGLARPDADFWVGLEGGIEMIGDQLIAFAWMAVLGANGRLSEARSVSLPLPPAVRDLVDSGLELGEANDRVFATVNSKHEGGAFGLLTNGRYTREGVYAQTLSIALIPFVNALYQPK